MLCHVEFVIVETRLRETLSKPSKIRVFRLCGTGSFLFPNRHSKQVCAESLRDRIYPEVQMNYLPPTHGGEVS